MAELKKRKEALNLAIVYVDPDAFIANFVGGLEITAFITVQRAGLARMPDNGITPALSEEQLKRADVQNVGIEDNLPVLRETLEDTRNDQPFIANSLLKLAPAVDMELDDEYQGFLRSLARRIYVRCSTGCAGRKRSPKAACGS